MYEQVDKKRREPRDRMLVICLLIALLLVAAATPPMFVAVNASYRYHHFILDFSNELVEVRDEHTRISLTENGEKKPVTSDQVSRMFTLLADCGFGKVLKTEPYTDYFMLTLPNGTTLTVWNTPQEHSVFDEPNAPITGVTVRYAPAEGKTFIYMQRDCSYEALYNALH